jgi:hypothetical protein
MLLDLAALKAAEVQQTPFPHLVVPFFLPRQHLAEAIKDYPDIDMAGIFPLDAIEGGPMFQRIVAEMKSPELRDVVAAKFGMDLSNHGTMVTARACCRATDGKIHADATFKKATLLLYLNDEEWKHEGGRLRVLRSATDIEDYHAEVAPVGGMLFAFKCVEHAWHGHKSFEGVRRYVMMNFVEDAKVLQRELTRHRFTAGVKRIKRMLGIGKIGAA